MTGGVDGTSGQREEVEEESRYTKRHEDAERVGLTQWERGNAT